MPPSTPALPRAPAPAAPGSFLRVCITQICTGTRCSRVRIISGDTYILDDGFFRRFRSWETAELGHSPVIADNYIRQAKWLLDWARTRGDRPDLALTQVTGDLIRSWLAHAEERGLAERTRKGVVISLRALFTFAAKVLHLDGPNPATGVRYPKVQRMESPILSRRGRSLPSWTSPCPRATAGRGRSASG